MFISKTPMRISFVGGGSDLEKYFLQSEGCVVGSTIDFSVYITSISLPKHLPEKYRFTYRLSENVQNAEEITHPVVRLILSSRANDDRLNLATFADLPGGSGLGGSSAFTVGLLNLLAAIDNKKLTAEELARMSVEIERKQLNEAGGWQDQYHAAYGGFRSYNFSKEGVQVSNSFLEGEQLVDFGNYFSLVPVGKARASEEIQYLVEKRIQAKEIELFEDLSEIAKKTKLALMTLSTAEDAYSVISEGMRESWNLKKKLSSAIAPRIVEECISIGTSSGAYSAKLCGAGGSGFVLFAHKPQIRRNLQEIFGDEQVLPVKFSQSGSAITEIV